MLFYVDGSAAKVPEDPGNHLSPPQKQDSMQVTNQSNAFQPTPAETPRQTLQGEEALLPSRRQSGGLQPMHSIIPDPNGGRIQGPPGLDISKIKALFGGNEEKGIPQAERRKLMEDIKDDMKPMIGGLCDLQIEKATMMLKT